MIFQASHNKISIRLTRKFTQLQNIGQLVTISAAEVTELRLNFKDSCCFVGDSNKIGVFVL